MSDTQEAATEQLRLGPPLIEITDLEVNFKARVGLIAGLMGKTGTDAKAVDGVDLVLHEGEVLAVAGESGCGKTTTARAILGLIQPDKGTISFRGKKLPTDTKGLRPFRREVQMVFQDPTASLNPRQTVYEIVAEGLRIHKIEEGPNGENESDLVAQALSRAGLRPPERFFLSYPHELSGGQRQRVVIAGALVLEPNVIIADEPVSNLDASVRGEILALLMKFREELNISLMIVTHDLGLAWTVADRVAVMYLGRVVEIGPTAEVLLRPRHPYTKALLDVVPEAGGPTVRSCKASRRTRRASRRAADSIRDVPSSHQAARKSWGSRNAARARTSPCPTWVATITSPRVTWWSSTSSRRLLCPLDLLGLVLGGLVAAQHPEDRRHLGIAHRRVLLGTGARRGQESSEVRLGHLGSILQLARALGETARASLGVVASRPGVAGVLPELANLGAQLGVLAPEIDQLVGHGPPEIGVRRDGAPAGRG